AGIHGQLRFYLVGGGGGVDAELAAELAAGRVEALPVDAGAPAVLTIVITRPDDGEVANGVHGQLRLVLGVGGGGVDGELAADGMKHVLSPVKLDRLIGRRRA